MRLGNQPLSPFLDQQLLFGICRCMATRSSGITQPVDATVLDNVQQA
jgi:hypothetical protein